jgi:hypothetical protein
MLKRLREIKNELHTHIVITMWVIENKTRFSSLSDLCSSLTNLWTDIKENFLLYLFNGVGFALFLWVGFIFVKGIFYPPPPPPPLTAEQQKEEKRKELEEFVVGYYTQVGERRAFQVDPEYKLEVIELCDKSDDKCKPVTHLGTWKIDSETESSIVCTASMPDTTLNESYRIFEQEFGGTSLTILAPNPVDKALLGRAFIKEPDTEPADEDGPPDRY